MRPGHEFGPDPGVTDPDETPPRLISTSPDRTLLVRESVTGAELFKIFERGSMAEAEAEARMGGLVTAPGVVRYRGARRDPRTGRPCVVMDYHPGVNLEQCRAERGPLPPGAARRLGASLARTLAELHEARAPEAPHGVIHRDVKPTNVFLVGEEIDLEVADVLLLDFEHAVARSRDERPATGFTGGTHGFAPPEAYAGVEPNPSFDVFGLGATLHYMLTGCAPFSARDRADIGRAVRQNRRPRWHLWGQPEPLADLVEACLAPDPAARPTMREIAAALADGGDHDADAELDDVLAALQRADLAQAAEWLAAAAETETAAPRRHAELQRLLRRRTRLLERAGDDDGQAPAGRDPHELARDLVADAPRLASWLARFPGWSAALARARRLHDDLSELLHRAPLTVTAHMRTGEYPRAEELLKTTMRAAAAVEALPEPAPDRDATLEAVPGPMHREPQRYLQLALQDLRDTANRHAALVEELEAAEARLDLNDARRVLDTAAAQYGGASPIVAALKDRTHRLGFFLERISHPTPGLRELAEQLTLADVDLDLEPIEELQRLCGERAAGFRLEGHPQRPGSVRVLHRMLHDLLSEFPHTEEVTARAVAALDRAMVTLTDQCWELVGDARQKLTVEPIPVRPLQLIVHRLDAFRRLEVLVDRPDRPRAELLDEHERLRLEVDQARTARDRLARGAEQDMERGHWTTALYDMERAVDRFAGDTDEVGLERQRMVDQLEQARRKKDEIDRAAAENIRLAAHFDELQDDPDSDYESRLAVLEERRRLLRLLVDHLPAERGDPYNSDLRDLELVIAQEQTDHAESVLDATTDPRERERIALRTIELLRSGTDPVAGRRQRMLDHWQHHLENAQQQVVALRAEQSRHRRLPIAVAAALVAVVGVVYFAGLGGEDPLAELASELDGALTSPFELTAAGDRPAFDKAGAYGALSAFVQRLERARVDPAQLPAYGEVVADAEQLVSSIRGLVNQGLDFELETWAAAFANAVDAYEASLAALTTRAGDSEQARRALLHLRRFGDRAVEAGLFSALADARSEPQRRALAPIAERAPAKSRAAVEQLLK